MPNDYYAAGSAELATESAVLLSKLSQRLERTGGDERLVVVLVGLPGRGKSFIARKLRNFMRWTGSYDCEIFNVGKYRRLAEEGQGASADFFDSKNAAAAEVRQKAATLALEDMLKWIDEPFEDTMSEMNGHRNGSNEPPPKGRVGIFDATNSTKERRDWILFECTHPAKRAGRPTGVVFVESICNDADLMRENLLTKVSSSPDYEGWPLEEAMADIAARCEKYEEAYETIDEDEDDDLSYVKIYNLSSKVMVNHIYGMLAKSVVPALMAWNIGTRPIYLCRPAAELPSVESAGSRDDDDIDAGYHGGAAFQTLRGAKTQVTRRTRGTLIQSKVQHLDDAGVGFRDALCEFMRKECLDFADRRRKEIAKPKQGRKGRGSLLTVVHGVGGFENTQLSRSISTFGLDAEDADEDAPFPCHIATSTIPRARETVAWKNMPSKALSNFNPLDKGGFTGLTMEEIEEKDPEWYGRYVKDPFYTRFPGGECQADLILRLEPMATCLEQQVEPVLIVSHASVLQALVCYLRGDGPVERCTDIDLPLDTVLKFTPAKGGGWRETRHNILEVEDESEEEGGLVSIEE